MFQDNIGVLCMQHVHLEKDPPFVYEFCKSNYLERRYGENTAFFKITKGCDGMQHIHVKRGNFSNPTTWRGDMGGTAFFKITKGCDGMQHVHLKKVIPICLGIFQTQLLGEEIEIFKIT